jgi:hypothetical protein
MKNAPTINQISTVMLTQNQVYALPLMQCAVTASTTEFQVLGHGGNKLRPAPRNRVHFTTLDRGLPDTWLRA